MLIPRVFGESEPGVSHSHVHEPHVQLVAVAPGINNLRNEITHYAGIYYKIESDLKFGNQFPRLIALPPNIDRLVRVVTKRLLVLDPISPLVRIPCAVIRRLPSGLLQRFLHSRAHRGIPSLLLSPIREMEYALILS